MEKADSSEINDLKAEPENIASKFVIDGLVGDIKKISDKLDLAIEEPMEIEKRKANIIIKGLPEIDEKTTEAQVNEVFKILKVDSSNIKKIHRLGAKKV